MIVFTRSPYANLIPKYSPSVRQGRQEMAGWPAVARRGKAIVGRLVDELERTRISSPNST